MPSKIIQSNFVFLLEKFFKSDLLLVLGNQFHCTAMLDMFQAQNQLYMYFQYLLCQCSWNSKLVRIYTLCCNFLFLGTFFSFLKFCHCPDCGWNWISKALGKLSFKFFHCFTSSFDIFIHVYIIISNFPSHNITKAVISVTVYIWWMNVVCKETFDRPVSSEEILPLLYILWVSCSDSSCPSHEKKWLRKEVCAFMLSAHRDIVVELVVKPITPIIPIFM